MPISKFSNIKITLSFIVLVFLIRINSQPTHDITGSCFGDDKADQYNSQTDIDKAITPLISNASNTYFGSISTGSGTDQFNALYYCRYDFSLQTCKSCVESAFNRVRSLCFPNKESYRYFEECMVYYSNNSISAERIDKSIRSATSGGRNLTPEEQSNFRQILDKTISYLTNNMSSEFNTSSRNFATTAEKYSSTETLYAVGQCNPYIAPTNCSTCLREIFDWFMTPAYSVMDVTYAQIMSPICRLSYLLSNEELSRPWNFVGYIARHPSVSSGTRGSSIIGAIVASVALCLKLLL